MYLRIINIAKWACEKCQRQSMKLPVLTSVAKVLFHLRRIEMHQAYGWFFKWEGGWRNGNICLNELTFRLSYVKELTL